MEINKKQLYQRQTVLAEVGEKGQKKLERAKVAVIGCGGLGSTAAVYLAGSGIGHIHLIDYDNVDVSNLHRQVFYGIEDVGRPKAEILKSHINKINPYISVTIGNKAVLKSNINQELSEFNCILDCTDSLATKYLINDYCVLQNKVLIYGSLYKHDGYVATFNHPDDDNRSANLRDAFPEMPKQHVPNCSENRNPQPHCWHDCFNADQ